MGIAKTQVVGIFAAVLSFHVLRAIYFSDSVSFEEKYYYMGKFLSIATTLIKRKFVMLNDNHLLDLIYKCYKYVCRFFRTLLVNVYNEALFVKIPAPERIGGYLNKD